MSATDGEAGAVERSALRKAYWRILPLIGLGYAIAYTDRINISFAAAKMNQDLGFSAAVYGLGGGLFFLSYALFEVPSNLLLVRFGARRWIARIMLTWGLLATAMMFVRNKEQFYAVRFLLGLAEAGFFPGVIYYLGQWFPAAHRTRSISRFYVAWPLSQVVMGAVAGALLGLHGTLGLSGWQWLFMVEGLPAVGLSAVILFLLPDKPETAKWLTAPEKAWISGELAKDAARIGQPEHGLWRAMSNPVVLWSGAMNFLNLGAFYAFTLSAPILLGAATHMDPTRVGYLISLAGLAGVVGMLANGWLSDRNGERYLHLAIPFLLLAASYVVLGQTTSPWLVIAGYVAAVMAGNAVSAVFWSVPGELLSPASAAASVAAINTIGQLGSFISPYLWGLAKDYSGGYHLGVSVLPVAFVLAAGIVLYLRHQAKRTRLIVVAAG